MVIVVGGYIVGYPLGGMTWHYLNYLAGLHALGHEVWFLESTGDWTEPYDPSTNTCSPDPTYGLRYLRETFESVGLSLRFCYESKLTNTWHGLSREELHALLKRADLLLCVSGVTPINPEWPRVKRSCVIDTDPVFTQLRMSADAGVIDYYKQFNAVATFGKLIGTPACPLPTHGFDWIPTNQPIALDHWPVAPMPVTRTFSTLGKWEHTGERHIAFDGQTFLSSKAVEWMKLLDLPARTSARLEMGMAMLPGETRSHFEQHGWHFVDAIDATKSADSYRSFIRSKAGELTVAKQIYATLPSGWFSDRSACFLASGRPVITQSSGFEQWLPTGEGLFSFATIDDAAAALECIEHNPAEHARAARAIAEEYFNANRVLRTLLAHIFE